MGDVQGSAPVEVAMKYRPLSPVTPRVWALRSSLGLDEPIPGTSRLSDLQQIARDCAGQGETVRFCVVRGDAGA